MRSLLRVRELQLESERAQQRARRDGALARAHDLRGIVYESDAMHRVVVAGRAGRAVRRAGADHRPERRGQGEDRRDRPRRTRAAGSKPLVKVNAGAIPDELLESELFGAEPGAFTGATRLRIGRFEAAHGGTLFLDEIGNLSAAGQMKLLRVLQTGEFERLGSSETRRVDVRVLCATNADLQQAIARGTFRQDLYFRIDVVELAVPAAARAPRGRPAARRGVPRAAEDDSAKRARAALLAHDWPGNVRELQNRIQRATAIGTRRRHHADGPRLRRRGAKRAAKVPVERARSRWRCSTQRQRLARGRGAGRLSRQALYRRMEKLGIVLERRPR